MRQRIFVAIALLTTFLPASAFAQAAGGGDAILGTWKANEKVLTIEVYKQGQEYHARIVSFTDHHNGLPAAQRTDDKNPDPALRSRKLIGTDVLSGLKYSSGSKSWTGGKIYNAGSGSTYSANVELVNPGKLSVRAYKGVSLIGKTLTFHR